MTKEDKDLLLRDLCARLPYDVKIERTLYGAVALNERHIESFTKGYDDILMPYLRPLSSMTESERKEFDDLSKFDEDVWMGNHKVGFPKNVRIMSKCVDWLNKKMFDYHGLILKGLALEAPERMYN